MAENHAGKPNIYIIGNLQHGVRPNDSAEVSLYIVLRVQSIPICTMLERASLQSSVIFIFPTNNKTLQQNVAIFML